MHLQPFKQQALSVYIQVTFDVHSTVHGLQIRSEKDGFIKNMPNKVICSVTAANPPPLFRFIIRYNNDTLEEISRDRMKERSIFESPSWAPTLTSTASFDFIAREDEEASHIFCLAFQITDPLSLPHLSVSLLTNFSSNIAGMMIRIIQGRPPIIRRFYSVPSQPVVGQRFKLHCLLESDAPIWDVRAFFTTNNGHNISFPLRTKKPIILTDQGVEELYSGHTIAERRHDGMYR
jgi:hypothetical protein